jgi:hypothetical protein
MASTRLIPFLVLALLSLEIAAIAQERTIIGGTVMDAETLKPIPDVYVILNNDRVIAATDSGGYFEIRLPEDSYLLEFRHVAYRSKFYPIRVLRRQGQMLLIELRPRVIPLPEVAITERLDRIESLDERNTYAVIKSEQIEKSRAANLQEMLMQLAPSAGMMYSTPGIMANQRPPLLYINGIRTESWVANLLDIRTIDRILIWRTAEAPITYRSELSRYLIDIRTKHK